MSTIAQGFFRRGIAGTRHGIVGTNHDKSLLLWLMKHPKIVWNFNTKQWFCKGCGRTSDHVMQHDAHLEIEQFDCQLPYVETVDTRPGEETVQLIKKPFKMELRDKTD